MSVQEHSCLSDGTHKRLSVFAHFCSFSPRMLRVSSAKAPRGSAIFEKVKTPYNAFKSYMHGGMMSFVLDFFHKFSKLYKIKVGCIIEHYMSGKEGEMMPAYICTGAIPLVVWRWFRKWAELYYPVLDLIIIHCCMVDLFLWI